ncbi:MAG: glycosyltransferase, partial [Raineya sp.]
MKPLKVAFVAVLKPTNDIRLFQKLAHCWLETGFQVHCFGFGNTKPQAEAHENIHFYTIFRKSRLHWSRFFVGWRLLGYLLKIRPQMVVCAAVEILPFCVFYKFIAFLAFRKVHLIYDVQENYAANILFTQTYPKIFRYFLAKIVRFSEWICSWWVDMFFLAEKCYAQELPFVNDKFLILENKFLKSHLLPQKIAKNSKMTFLHSGTLAKEYGTEKVLEIIKNLAHQNSDYQFAIIGKCSNEALFAQIEKLSNKNIFIKISPSPIAYEEILLFYQKANVILMPYQINEAYKNRIPTKFYEAMAHNAWIWVQDNPAWHLFFEEYAYRKVVFSDFWSENLNFNILPQISFLEEKPYFNPNIF